MCHRTLVLKTHRSDLNGNGNQTTTFKIDSNLNGISRKYFDQSMKSTIIKVMNDGKKRQQLGNKRINNNEDALTYPHNQSDYSSSTEGNEDNIVMYRKRKGSNVFSNR